jgi:diacylglycerol kinase (ATP)
VRVLAVGNPASSGFSEDVRAAVDRELPGAEWFAPEDGDLAEAAAGAEVVVVAGGDGSLNHAINVLADRLTDVTFGLVPAGTGNDFARSAGVPDDPEEAARVIARGRVHAFDVGRATGGGVGRLFVNACMGGFPVQVDEAIDEDTKDKLGPLAFWVGGAKAAAHLRRSTVAVDGIKLADCVAAGVGNGRTCGGGIPVWPGADPSDGVLDACALAAPNAAAAVKLLMKVRAGDHEDLDEVRTARGGRMVIDADPPIELNVDGELVGLTTPATFEVWGTLRLIT